MARHRIAVSLQGLARAALAQGELARARALLAEALALYDEMGAERHATSVRNLLAEAEFRAGNVAEAVRLVTRCLTTLRAFGYTIFVVRRLNNLAAYSIALDRFREARGHASEALDIARWLEPSLAIPCALQHLAAVAALWPENGGAGPTTLTSVARIVGYVDAAIAALGGKRDDADDREYERLLTVLRAAIAPEILATLMDEGQTMSQHSAIEQTLAFVSPG